MKKAIWFIKKVIIINKWNTKNLRWYFYPIAVREYRQGYCQKNVGLGWSKEKKDFVFRKTAEKGTSIIVYANDEVEAVFLSAHELFHFLMSTNQLKKSVWKNTNYFANIFGLIILMKFLKGVEMVEECPNCGSTDVIIKYKLRSQFSAIVDLASLTVLESPKLEKIDDEGPVEFSVECENCGTQIEIDEQQKSYVLELMSVYDFGVRT